MSHGILLHPFVHLDSGIVLDGCRIRSHHPRTRRDVHPRAANPIESEGIMVFERLAFPGYNCCHVQMVVGLSIGELKHSGSRHIWNKLQSTRIYTWLLLCISTQSVMWRHDAVLWVATPHPPMRPTKAEPACLPGLRPNLEVALSVYEHQLLRLPVRPTSQYPCHDTIGHFHILYQLPQLQRKWPEKRLSSHPVGNSIQGGWISTMFAR